MVWILEKLGIRPGVIASAEAFLIRSSKVPAPVIAAMNSNLDPSSLHRYIPIYRQLIIRKLQQQKP
ncbi:hypothetical protein FH966_01640 [Lentibacillus cibarius]|uniref:Uncharacterized protein n=1 Tax=Lentibacillus cibarius TaxID=2583219 RepID=A0A549YF66_9BACI|nr:hypothetical protein [Lentibacillus cibarius]TRM10526.1 hypothetical protein FH966_01640 [Lentibacillus cibarius]